MPEISEEHRARMRRRYDPKVAQFLVTVAKKTGKKVTYGELSAKFGLPARSWGDPLGGIALVCHDNDLPILPVLVVLKSTGQPSPGAALYRDLGFTNEAKMRVAQQQCYDYDWATVSFN